MIWHPACMRSDCLRFICRFCRTFGTFLSIVLFSWRYYHYPDSYPRVAEPIVVFFFVSSEVFDILYAFVYAHIERKEKAAVKDKSR